MRPSVVRDRAAALVERDARQRDAAVADAAQDDAAGDDLALARRDGAELAALVGDQGVADDLDRLDLAVAEDRDRGDEKAEKQLARLALGLARGVLAQQVDVAACGRAVLGERGLAGRVEHEVGRVDDHVCAGELAELLQLRVRERRLHRAAAAEHHDLLQAGADDRVHRGLRRVGRVKLLVRQREHPGDVDRDVPVPDDDGALAREVERHLLEVGMAVVPGDENSRGPRAGQVLARDVHPPVGLRADRVDDGVVERVQLGRADLVPDVDVAEEPEAGLLRGLLEDARDRLDLRVVGRDAEPDEAPRGREPLDHVDHRAAREQRGRRVEGRRAGTDHGNAQLPIGQAG